MKRTKNKKWYLIEIHGFHKNPDELEPGEAIVGGLGGEVPRSLTMFIEVESDGDAKREAEKIKNDWLKTPHGNIAKVTKVEIYRIEEVL